MTIVMVCGQCLGGRLLVVVGKQWLCADCAFDKVLLLKAETLESMRAAR